MLEKALVIIDIQNDITKNYKEIIDNINQAIDWATSNDIHVVYIRHEYLSDSYKTFKPNTYGAEFVSDLKIVSGNIFTKNSLNALGSEEFTDFIRKNEIREFYITGADAIACVKTTCYNLRNDAMLYLLDQYKTIAAMNSPALALFGDYNIYEQRGFEYAAYENSGDLADRILGYNFNRIKFAPNEDGELWLGIIRRRAYAKGVSPEQILEMFLELG